MNSISMRISEKAWNNKSIVEKTTDEDGNPCFVIDTEDVIGGANLDENGMLTVGFGKLDRSTGLDDFYFTAKCDLNISPTISGIISFVVKKLNQFRNVLESVEKE